MRAIRTAISAVAIAIASLGVVAPSVAQTEHAAQQAEADQNAAIMVFFDEIDAGIGGQTAFEVGKKLKSVASYNQVICITHLPQVAARGNTHWQVSKSPEQGQIVSRITPLTDSERVAEIARMLGGATLTDTTRRHAAELLAGEEGA